MALNRDIRMLMRYTVWANQRLYSALSEASQQVVYGARPGRPDGLAQTLGHALVVDRICKAHLEGKAHGLTSRTPVKALPLEELRLGQIASDQWYTGYVDALQESSLDQRISFTFVDGKPGILSRGDILLHIVNHKTYHRGYIADMLYESGLRPPTIDLPVFLQDEMPGC